MIFGTGTRLTTTSQKTRNSYTNGVNLHQKGKTIMLNRLRNEVAHVCGELVSGDHRAAWWVVLAADAVGVLLLTNLL